MTREARKNISIIVAVCALLLAGVGSLQAAGEDMYDYTKIPPFIEVGLNPNLLMLIDNSASMYDPAYTEPGSTCYADDYLSATAYAGYFDPAADSWYRYSTTNQGFLKVTAGAAATFCSGATGTKYTATDLCLTVNVTSLTPYVASVTAFAAKGRFLNWLAASRFDVEKEILTGGKYDPIRDEMVLESRGCLEERFVKQALVKKDGTTDYFATFGIRPPTSSEKGDDATYYGDPNIFSATSNTRIEIFKPTLTGFNASACADAVTAWTTLDPNEDVTGKPPENTGLGILKAKTAACMGGDPSLISASHTALNFILQECWYYKENNEFQSGLGAVTSLRNACVNVYNASPGSLPTAGLYVPPGSLQVSDVCSGVYGPSLSDPWGYGYVGKCWEPAVAMIKDVCDGSDWPQSAVNADQDALGNYFYCDLGVDGDGNPNTGWYLQCNKKPNSSGNCPGGWFVRQVYGALPGVVDWTNDNMAVGGTDKDNSPPGEQQGHTCINDALRSYCQDLDDVTVVDPTVTDPLGTAWSLPAVLIGTAAESQLGEPLRTLKGRVHTTVAPNGLIHEFKYNLRMGAMKFNPGPFSECAPVQRDDGTWKASLYDCLADKGSYITNTPPSVPEASQKDGGKIVREIDDGDVHVEKLVTALNNIPADAWTPLAEAYSEAVGYYTQNSDLRLNNGDYVCDTDSSDSATYPLWLAGHDYAAGDKVRFGWDHDNNLTVDETKVYFTDAGGTSSAGAATIGDDQGVRWSPYDPVQAGCQKNNILLITDGRSTADLNSDMTTFVRTAGHNDGDVAATYAGGITETANYECKTPDGASALFGSTLLDDLSFYAQLEADEDLVPPRPSIFVYPTVDNLDKQVITTYVVAAGTLVNDGTTYDCNPKILLEQVAANSGTTLYDATDPALLEVNLRKIFTLIGGEPASGSAASVISNSRSGEGAIFQAVFYPEQEDSHGNEISWAGDVHALWLDERGNIREDCGPSACGVANADAELDKQVDRILQFFTDEVSHAARARVFSDANGDGFYNPVTDLVVGQENISLRDIPYIWSAGKWLSLVDEDTDNDVLRQRAYGVAALKRHIITSVNGRDMIPFTATALGSALSAAAYRGYFNAAIDDEANDIIGYVRGDDTKFTPAGTPRGYRSRKIDWDENNTVETWKLGDVVNSTPTVVSTPAEDYDLIYGDKSYQEFRKRYRNRRAVVYAGGNDGGLHAFNAGYYNRSTDTIDKAPPKDVVNGVLETTSKVEYDLGSELWMFVPKNVFPHLKWLTQANYSHVNYVDLKPYIFDAKIFDPTDSDHPHGWGTILVGGMGFGGGNIGVNTNGVVGDGDDEIMRSSYFVLDITNPEKPPTLLKEFTDPGLGYGVGSPTAIPLLLCTIKHDCPTNTSVATTWPMDWYLALPSGPHDDTLPLAALNGRSDQPAKIFTLELGSTASGSLGYADTALYDPGYTTFTVPVTDADFDHSFFSDVIAVDYDLDFKTDTLYFGSVAAANQDETYLHTGGIHRLVINEVSNPSLWTLNTFFKTPDNQPVSGSPSVAYDGQRAWLYFGTGRYYSAQLDKTNYAQQSYYGIKENYTNLGVMDLYAPSDANLVEVTNVWVESGTGELHLPISDLFVKAHDYAGPDNLGENTELVATTFKELDHEMSLKESGLDKYNGWKLDFNTSGERNLGQAAILGNIVTFTTFQPSVNLCTPEGESFLWAPYYRTGTSYSKSVIGTKNRDGDTEVTRRISVGAGLASTPNIHSGAQAGSTAFVQTSTGAIISVQQINPGVVKSGMISWRELGE